MPTGVNKISANTHLHTSQLRSAFCILHSGIMTRIRHRRGHSVNNSTSTYINNNGNMCMKINMNIRRMLYTYTCALLLLNINFLSSAFVQASVISILPSYQSPSQSQSQRSLPVFRRLYHHQHGHQHHDRLLMLIRGGAATATASAAVDENTTKHGSGKTKTATATTTSATMEGLKSSLASALAAGCSKTLLAPFDTLKTIQQNYRSQSIGTATATATSLNFWQAMKLVTARPKGIRELYVSLVGRDDSCWCCWWWFLARSI